mmetsp:Transcript_1062/g.1268  ORF Transcript_1062/g.1268 Transcript_1062/m.1268 type:complete len:82 (+) Transcript_1062:347-592(+)
MDANVNVITMSSSFRPQSRTTVTPQEVFIISENITPMIPRTPLHLFQAEGNGNFKHSTTLPECRLAHYDMFDDQNVTLYES